MIERLLPYDAIAWDFDGTLIEHPKSALMQAFIISQPQKQHFIVTFRTHGYQKQMFREMRDLYPDAPGPECFADVLNISDKAWEQFTKIETQRLMHKFAGPPTPWEEYYVEWKGLICERLKIPVLVDDRRAQVLPGCEKYAIAYLHPDEL